MNEKDHEYMKKLYNQEVKFDVSKFNQLKKEESKKNKEIEKELSLARERQKMEFVLLLLGLLSFIHYPSLFIFFNHKKKKKELESQVNQQSQNNLEL